MLGFWLGLAWLTNRYRLPKKNKSQAAAQGAALSGAHGCLRKPTAIPYKPAYPMSVKATPAEGAPASEKDALVPDGPVPDHMRKSKW